MESREESGVRTLEYYGGARGQYLLTYPDGRMYVTGKRRAPTEEEEDVGTAPDEPSDSVSIGQPPENASVAEAKPVSVAIAGEGGVASAAPIGQAIVGPGGLAISRYVFGVFITKLAIGKNLLELYREHWVVAYWRRTRI